MDGDPKPAADVLATRPNGRGPAPLVVNKEGRKPLFANKSTRENTNAANAAEPRPASGRYGYSESNARAKGGSTRPSSSGSHTPSIDRSSSTAEAASPGSRIPRPRSAIGVFSKARRPISLTEAYRMAEAEEARTEEAERARKASPAGIDVSPSPAPRPHLSRHESDEGRMRKMLNRGPLDFGRARRLSRQSSDSIREDDTRRSTESLTSQKSGSTSSDFDRKLSQYEQEQGQSPSSPRRRNGLFGKSRIGPKVAETGQALAKKTSSSSLSERPREAFPNGQVPKGWIKRFMSMPDKDDEEDDKDKGRNADWEESADVPLPSIEAGTTPQEPTPPSSRPASANLDARSPEKSYAWMVDADFTAGDLQVSDSPRIKMGNTRSDELLSRKLSNDAAFSDNQGVDAGSAGTRIPTKEAGSSGSERSRSRSSNTKLDEIRQREIDAEKEYEMQTRNQPKPKNTKLDEIRAREMEFLSKKALATSRLEEIREQNSMSRSLSPETRSQRSREFARESTPGFDTETHQRTIVEEEEEEGEQIPNTPVTIFRKPHADKDVKSETSSQREVKLDSRSSSSSRPSLGHTRGDSRDLLRRLARAASTSPAPESSRERDDGIGNPERIVKDDSDKKSSTSRHSSRDDQKGSTPEIKEPDRTKPTVGFAGLRRQRSTDSVKEKRSSRALSDNDPTERIEGEMLLFAPAENHSERGSVRGPSPDTSDDEDDEERNPVEETPRAPKRDPLSLPTPKVTGAYIDTPVAIKPENLEERLKASSDALPTVIQIKASSVRRRGSDSSSRRSKSVRSDSGSESHVPEATTTATTTAPVRATVRRRARSLPRSRQPLINTARPPTVRDDLLEIQRSHQIEDSTLDDFEELFGPNRAPSPELQSIIDDMLVKREEAVTPETEDKSERKSELERYDRMNKSLKDGLLGIRTAKQGIERLEDKVAHSENAAPKAVHEEHVHTHNCTTCAGQEPTSSVAYVHLPIPRLYHRKPFRLTFLGLILLTFSLWYTAETAVCEAYCRPLTCSSAPCIWSFDDPTWGNAIPVKLDQWLTNGWGREQVNRLSEEVWDMYAEASDFVTGTDITEVDIKTLGFYEKRQHRRRLRKKGLIKPRVEPPEHKAKWDAWHTTRLAKERAREAKEMGYDMAEDEESIGDDERVW